MPTNPNDPLPDLAGGMSLRIEKNPPATSQNTEKNPGKTAKPAKKKQSRSPISKASPDNLVVRIDDSNTDHQSNVPKMLNSPINPIVIQPDPFEDKEKLMHVR